MTARYETPLAAAYVRGTARISGKPALSSELAQTPLEALTDSELTQIISAGLQAGMNLYHFKKKMTCPGYLL